MDKLSTAMIKVDDFKAFLKMMFRSGTPVKVNAGAGQGKTEMSHQYAEEQGPDYGLFEMNVALASLPDVIGFLLPRQESQPDADGNDRQFLSGHYTMPYFMRDLRTNKPSFAYKRGMLLLEEWGQGQADVKRALATAIHEKRLGAHLFPDGCDVLILSNRPEDRSGVGKEFDFLINRWCEVELMPSADAWIVHASERGVQNETIAFAARNRDLVFSGKVPERQMPWLTPRSLVAADRVLKAAKEDKLPLDHDLVFSGMAGTIGMSGAQQYIAFAKLRDKLPKFEAIVKDPEGADLPSDHPDQLMFLAYDLASRTTKENCAKVVVYIDRFPIDFATAYYRAAVRRDRALIGTKVFGDWMATNVKLLAAVA